MATDSLYSGEFYPQVQGTNTGIRRIVTEQETGSVYETIDIVRNSDPLHIDVAYQVYLEVFGGSVEKGGWNEFVKCDTCDTTYSYEQYVPELELNKDEPLLQKFLFSPQRRCKEVGVDSTCNGRLGLVFTPRGFRDNLENLRERNGYYHLLFKDGKVIGFISGYPTDNPLDIWNEHSQEFESTTARRLFVNSYEEHFGKKMPKIGYVDDIGVIESERGALHVQYLYNELATSFKNECNITNTDLIICWTATISKIHSLMRRIKAEKLFSDADYRKDNKEFRAIFAIPFGDICKFLKLSISFEN